MQPITTDRESISESWTERIDNNGTLCHVNTETGEIKPKLPTISTFLNKKSYCNHAIDPIHWDLRVETMATSIHPQQQRRIFQKLKGIINKITREDPKYRTLYLNNPKLQQTVLAFDGGLEILYDLGFEPQLTSKDILVCQHINQCVINAALASLTAKINELSYTKKLHSDDQCMRKYKCDCSSMEKTIIFICNANIATDSLSPNGFKRPISPFKTMVDKPLSKFGIKEANKLSTFITEHVKCNDAKRSIVEATNMLKIDIIGKHNNELNSKYPEMLSKLTEITDKMTAAINILQNREIKENEMYCNNNTEKLSTDFLMDKISDLSTKSIIVTSNLRTSISTAILTLWNRLNSNDEYIHILPSLRELGVNEKYTLNIESPTRFDPNYNTVQRLKTIYDKRLLIENEETWIDRRENLLIFGFVHSNNDEFMIMDVIDLIYKFYHIDSKKKSFDQYEQFNFVCDWIFGQNNDIYDTVIICGHHHWFREFVKQNLSDYDEIVEKRLQKIQICRVVGFKMCLHINCSLANCMKSAKCQENRKMYQIIKNSITTIYKGVDI